MIKEYDLNYLMAEEAKKEERRKRKEEERDEIRKAEAEKKALFHEMVMKAKAESAFPDRKPPEAGGRYVTFDKTLHPAIGFEYVEDINQLEAGDYIQIKGTGFGILSQVKDDGTLEVYFGKGMYGDMYRWYMVYDLIEGRKLLRLDGV